MRRLKGSVTLFALMIFMLVVSVISATITSARVNAARVFVGCAASMATDSVFSEYDPLLFSEFGVMGFDGRMGGQLVDENRIAAKIASYASYNLNGATLKGVDIETITRLTDAGGTFWYDQAVDYEKYSKIIDLAADFLQLNSKTDKAKAVTQVNDEITNCTRAIMLINQHAQRLVEWIDGVECPVNGIDFNYVTVRENFVKKMYPGVIIDEAVLRINQTKVVKAVKGEVINPVFMLSEAKDNYEKNEIAKADRYMTLFKDCINNELEALNAAIDEIMEIDYEVFNLKDGLNAASQLLSSFGNLLNSEELAGLSEEIDKLNSYEEVMAEEVCNVPKVKANLLTNKAIIEKLLEYVEALNWDNPKEENEYLFQQLTETLMRFSIKDLVINYTHLKKQPSNTGILDKLKDFLEDGVLTIVLPDGVHASQKKLGNIPLLAAEVCDVDAMEEMDMAKKIVYSEYVLDHFKSFTDGESGAYLNYETEYIIWGEKKDSTNLLETVLAIATLRSGVNMLYLLTDSEKKDEAYTMATALVGVTAIEPLIRLTQYSLMYYWSYAEALSDVRILLDGGKVGVAKTKETWKLSLEKMMNHDIKTGKDDGVRNGMDYEMFLRLFLFLESDGKKASRTMSLVEIYMMLNGKTGFRLYNYVYGIEMTSNYTVPGWNKEYSWRTIYAY